MLPFHKILTTSGDLKGRLYGKIGYSIDPGTTCSNQSEEYSSKWLIWLVCWEPLLIDSNKEEDMYPCACTCTLHVPSKIQRGAKIVVTHSV